MAGDMKSYREDTKTKTKLPELPDSLRNLLDEKYYKPVRVPDAEDENSDREIWHLYGRDYMIFGHNRGWGGMVWKYQEAVEKDPTLKMIFDNPKDNVYAPASVIALGMHLQHNPDYAKHCSAICMVHSFSYCPQKAAQAVWNGMIGLTDIPLTVEYVEKSQNRAIEVAENYQNGNSNADDS